MKLKELVGMSTLDLACSAPEPGKRMTTCHGGGTLFGVKISAAIRSPRYAALKLTRCADRAASCRSHRGRRRCEKPLRPRDAPWSSRVSRASAARAAQGEPAADTARSETRKLPRA